MACAGGCGPGCCGEGVAAIQVGSGAPRIYDSGEPGIGRGRVASVYGAPSALSLNQATGTITPLSYMSGVIPLFEGGGVGGGAGMITQVSPDRDRVLASNGGDRTSLAPGTLGANQPRPEPAESSQGTLALSNAGSPYESTGSPALNSVVPTFAPSSAFLRDPLVGGSLGNSPPVYLFNLKGLLDDILGRPIRCKGDCVGYALVHLKGWMETNGDAAGSAAIHAVNQGKKEAREEASKVCQAQHRWCECRGKATATPVGSPSYGREPRYNHSGIPGSGIWVISVDAWFTVEFKGFCQI